MKRVAEAFDIELGRRLRLVRLSKGLSQQFVGGHLGVSFQQVQKYEKGIDRLSVARLVRLRDLYRVPLESLIPEDGGAFPVPELGRQGARLVRDFEAIRSGEVRRCLAVLVRSLAEQGPTEPERTYRFVSPNSVRVP